MFSPPEMPPKRAQAGGFGAGKGAWFRLAQRSRHLGLPCPGCMTFLAMAETQLDRVLDLLARLGAPYIVRSEEAFSQAILNSLVL